jgi:phospholipid-translocating ATPase
MLKVVSVTVAVTFSVSGISVSGWLFAYFSVVILCRFACSLLRQGMRQIIVSLEIPEVIAAEEFGDKAQIAKVSRDSIRQQITSGLHQIELDHREDAPHALIIDGKSLIYALEDDMKKDLLTLAVQCASVICCRVSPKQKAMVC